METLHVVLASSSPRRKELLEQAGVSFDIVCSNVDEELDEQAMLDPFEACKTLAQRKANASVNALLADETLKGSFAVIGADTMVVCDNEIFGKPQDKDDGFRMLSALSGRSHDVATAVSVWLFTVDGEDLSIGFRSFVDVSRVTFKELTQSEIYDYLNTEEPYDKAGAYAIQGEAARFVDAVTGSFDTVVGLPVERLLRDYPFLKTGVVE